MRKRAAVLGGVIVLTLLVLLAARTFSGPGSVPAGQRPLLRLSSASFGEFRTAFDDGAGAPRLVLLLSPT
jgi:hypothetical protein